MKNLQEGSMGKLSTTLQGYLLKSSCKISSINRWRSVTTLAELLSPKAVLGELAVALEQVLCKV